MNPKIPTGKGIMIWNLVACGFGSDMVSLVWALVAAGITHVSVKILNGIYDTFGTSNPQNKELLPQFISLCKAAGIHVRGWQYTFGGSITAAAAEATKAVSYTLALGLEGFDIDAESEYKAGAISSVTDVFDFLEEQQFTLMGFDPLTAEQEAEYERLFGTNNVDAVAGASAAWALAYMAVLRPGLPEISISLCSFRYPSYHPEFPWMEFLNNGVDLHMPQVYWQGSTNPDFQLNKSYTELMAKKALPFVPVGSAYCEYGWCSTPGQLKLFSDTAIALQLPGISFWSMQHAYADPFIWVAIEGLNWGDPVPPDPDPDPDPIPVPPFPKNGKVSATSGTNLRPYPNVISKWIPGKHFTKTLPKDTPLLITGEEPDAFGYGWWVVKELTAGWHGVVAKQNVTVI